MKINPQKNKTPKISYILDHFQNSTFFFIFFSLPLSNLYYPNSNLHYTNLYYTTHPSDNQTVTILQPICNHSHFTQKIHFIFVNFQHSFFFLEHKKSCHYIAIMATVILRICKSSLWFWNFLPSFLCYFQPFGNNCF